ncbi:MAG: hypothetical protein R2685_13740 [Candidatus Nitrosocosmicus sp.]|nr:hypothetical protein [Candidatus Nitrosocosmicus sp.]
MVFNYLRKNKKVERGKIFVYSTIQAVLTFLVILSSFFIVGVPLFFVLTYLAAFVLFLIISLKYSNKILRFSKNDNGDLIVNFESITHVSYMVSTISRIMISLVVLSLRIKLLEIFGIEHSAYLIFQEPQITLIIFVTIIFDLLLLSSKGVMVGMHIQMLAKYKQNLTSNRGKYSK